MEETPIEGGGKRVVSGKSFERIKQEKDNWCYAATEWIVKKAYGIEVGSQEDIATHYWTEIEKPDAGQVDTTFGWIKGETPETSDDEARKQAKRIVAERAIFEKMGNYQLPSSLGSTIHSKKVVPDDAIKSTIRSDNLGIIGLGPHLTILYGYEEDANGKVTKVLTWDTLSGEDTPLSREAYDGFASTTDTVLFG